MIWLGLIVAIGIASLLIFSKVGGRKTVRTEVRDARARAADLPEEERTKLANEIRMSAHSNYDRIFTAAIDAGKDVSFAHQVGVLQAINAIVAPGRALSNTEHKKIQAESAPFNRLKPTDGCAAVTEYLVWKFFPALADQEAFASALTQFREWVYREAPTENDPDRFRFQTLFSMEYDWQRWLSEHRTDI